MDIWHVVGSKQMVAQTDGAGEVAAMVMHGVQPVSGLNGYLVPPALMIPEIANPGQVYR
jgi:hypothetical protein